MVTKPISKERYQPYAIEKLSFVHLSQTMIKIIAFYVHIHMNLYLSICIGSKLFQAGNLRKSIISIIYPKAYSKF